MLPSPHSSQKHIVRWNFYDICSLYTAAAVTDTHTHSHHTFCTYFILLSSPSLELFRLVKRQAKTGTTEENGDFHCHCVTRRYLGWLTNKKRKKLATARWMIVGARRSPFCCYLLLFQFFSFTFCSISLLLLFVCTPPPPLPAVIAHFVFRHVNCQDCVYGRGSSSRTDAVWFVCMCVDHWRLEGHSLNNSNTIQERHFVVILYLQIQWQRSPFMQISYFSFVRLLVCSFARFLSAYFVVLLLRVRITAAI